MTASKLEAMSSTVVGMENWMRDVARQNQGTDGRTQSMDTMPLLQPVPGHGKGLLRNNSPSQSPSHDTNSHNAVNTDMMQLNMQLMRSMLKIEKGKSFLLACPWAALLM